MKIRLSALSLIACMVLFPLLVHAADMTVKDVIELKKMSFSDQEVAAEIAKSGTKFTLTDADVAALKAAGASDVLIRAMKTPAVKVTLADVTQMVRDNKPVEDILDAIAASPDKPKATLADIRGLQELKTPMPIMLALKGTPLAAGDLRLLAENGAKPAVFDTLAAILGFAQQPVSAADAKALMDAGVPSPVVAKLKAAADAFVGGQPTPEKPADVAVNPPKPATPPPADELHPPEFIGTWSGTTASDYAGDGPCTLLLRADGSYALRIGGVSQVGKWRVTVDAGTFFMQPSPGSPETESYTMDATKTRLTITAMTGKMILTKQQ